MSEEYVEAGTSPNEGSAGGIGVGDVEGARHPPPPTPNWREFLDGLDKLNSSLGTKLDGIKETVTEGTRPPPAEPPDYAQMDNAQLVAHVTGSVQHMVQQAIREALTPITQQLAQTQNDLVSTRGEMSLKEMQAKHRDLADWKQEMIAAVGRHPTMSLEEVYDFVRGRNQKRAAELDLKYNPPPPKPRPFGGLTPSGNGRPAEPLLTGEAATRAAYAEVSAKHPGILPILQDL